MSVAGGSPLSRSINPPPPSSATPRRPWAPDRTAHLIYNWVKMEGQTQSWVASQLDISQTTVSRVIQRYERWQAHAAEREGGRLDVAERLRAQRWLTFERNELILANCLRIAQEMEGFVDTSKSTISRPKHAASQESEVRTVHSTIDRSGIASRFLRLAFRINMEQLKLAELDPPPLAPPLSDAELAQQDLDEIALAQELAHLTKHDSARYENQSPEPANESDLAQGFSPPQHSDPPLSSSPSPLPNTQDSPHSITSHPEPRQDPRPPHKTHNDHAPQIAATQAEPCTCTSHSVPEKNPLTCITASHIVGLAGNWRDALVAQQPDLPSDRPTPPSATPPSAIGEANQSRHHNAQSELAMPAPT